MVKISRAFGAQKSVKPHLLRSKGLAGEVVDLRGDVESGFKNLEQKTGYPLLTFMNGTNTISASTPAAHVVAGVNLLQGQVKASLVTGTGTSSVTFEAVRPGTPGNNIRIQLRNTGSLAVDSVVGEDIDVTYNGGVSTANDIASTINSDPDASILINATGGGTGTTIVPLTVFTNLVGGIGTGFSLEVAGVSQDLTNVTDTQIDFNSTNGGAAVAATGTITTIAGSLLVDTETFTLNDGVNPALVFEFDSGGGFTGDVQVVFTGGDTADQVRDAIISAVNSVGGTLNITASNGGAATVNLVNDLTGALGNQTILESVVNGGFVVAGMSGGVDGTFASGDLAVLVAKSDDVRTLPLSLSIVA